jgi:outer membrane protein assembly factor BamB
LLHATTGKPPFRDDRLAASLHAQRFSRPPSIGRDIDGVAAPAEVLAWALAKNPDHRFDSCGDFFAAVTAWAWDHREAGTVEVRSLSERRTHRRCRPNEAVRRRTTWGVPVRAGPGGRLRRRATRRRNPSPVMRGAPALAAAGVIIGTIAALVLVARLPSSPGSGDLAAASAPEAAPASSVAPGLGWRQALDAPVIGVRVVDAGVVAVTPEHVVVLDPARGWVRATLDSRQTSAAVTADGALVTAGTDGLQLHDLADRSVQWSTDIAGAGPPEIMGQTVYRVSDQGVPRLVALASSSGQRLWRYPDDDRALSADTVVVPGDDLVHLADDDAVLGVLPEGAALDAGTGERWERAGSWREAVLAGDGRLVAVEHTGVVSMLAANTGTVRTLDAVRLPSGALLAVGGGGLYAAGDDGTVVSVDLEDTRDERRRVGGMGATG